MSGKDFRVLIAGGSIAGLSLALALERHGVDYLVLEAHGTVAPQVGASIAVLPSGFRVLDQLGCYEDVMARVNCTIDHFVVRDADGSELVHVADLEEHLIGRTGYPMVFFERRMVIDVLHRKIRQRADKVLTGKRVVAVRQDEGGVEVDCQDGSTYAGSILVGADGVRSTVGRHVAGDDAAAGAGLPVEYRCLFGISDRVPGVGEDTLHHATNHGSSLFAASGPNDRTYWCLFTSLGDTYYGDALPPYGDADEADEAARHADDAVTETVRFRDLYERRLMSVSTPLHEGVLERWYNGRCILVGDAVHKFNPIIGLGGMSALETTASLTNHLVSMLASSGGPAPTTAEVEAAFASTQAHRRPRAKALVDVSSLTQHRFAMRTPWLAFLNRYYYPALGPCMALRWLTEAYSGAVSLDRLPEATGGSDRKDDVGLPAWLPATVRRALPYEDTLLRRPAARSSLAAGVIGVLLAGLAALAAALLLGVGKANGTFRLVDEAVWQGAVDVPGRGMWELRQVFGGGRRVAALDKLASTLVAVFLPVVAGAAAGGDDDAAVLERRLQAVYFLLCVYLPVVAVVLIEGSRRRNKFTLLWSPTDWLMAAQLLGLGLVLPLYVLAFYLGSSRAAYWMPAERFTPHSFSRAVLPALFLGLLGPSALVAAASSTSLSSSSPLSSLQHYAPEAITLWQVSPALTSWAAGRLSSLLARSRTSGAESKAARRAKRAVVEDYRELDMAGLRRAYNALFVVASAAHTAVLVTLVWTPNISLTHAFLPPLRLVPLFAQGGGVRQVAGVAEGVGVFLKLDLLLTVAAMLAWCLVGAAEMRRVGLLALHPARAAALLAVGCVVLGPGATFVAFWKRQEKKLARPEMKAKL